ncbi:MAG: caspase family protein [Pirellulaceae bacterium]
MVAATSNGTLIIDSRTQQRVQSASELPPSLRPLLSNVSQQFALPPNSEIETNEWLQMQGDIWKAAGGKTKNYRGSYDYWVNLWAPDGSVKQTYTKHRLTPSYVTVNRAGTIAASADQLGDIHVWDTSTGETKRLFRSKNHEIYNVAWDSSGTKLAFATNPLQSPDYNYNHFGVPHRTFNLRNRHLAEGVPSILQPSYRTPGTVAREGVRANQTNRLVARLKTGRTYSYKADQPGENPDSGLRGDPMCFEFINSHPGIATMSTPLAVGSDLGELQLLELQSNGRVMRRRQFFGHENMVTSISQSPESRMIASSSTDGTIRIWSLDDFTIYGDIDFDVRGTQVLSVPFGSEGEKAGIRGGSDKPDEILRFDGLDFYASRKRVLEGAYRPGQVVEVVVRNRSVQGSPSRVVRLTLAPVADQVEPLLSLFLANDGEWIIWSPDGYYDASPQADKYLGFHINQGREKSALWFTARQFEKHLYRPDVIDQIISTGRRFGEDSPAAPTVGPTSAASDLAAYRPPDVHIISPRDGLVTREDETVIRADIKSANSLPVVKIKLTVNGFPVDLEGDIDGLSKNQLRQRIKLQPGDNAITLTALNRETKSVERKIVVKCEAPKSILAKSDQPKKPTLHVLAVGVSKYKKSEINLQYAKEDAQDIANAWKSQSGGIYSDVKTHVLVDENATRANVLSNINQLIDNVDEGDRVIIHIAAHGATDQRDKYYLLTHDTNPEALRSTGIAHTDLVSAVDDLLANRCQVLLFVDTCHSGASVGSRGIETVNKLRQSTRDYWRNTGSVVFTSSLPGQESFEREAWHNGAFTEALLEALDFQGDSDANGDDHLSISELQLFLENRVGELTDKRQSPATRREPNTPGFDIAIKQ